MSWISEVGSFSITGNAGGAVTPVADNINIVGSGSIVVTGNPVLGTLTISGGGSVAITNHALAVGTGVTIASLALGTTGTVLTGVTGADPAFSASPTLTSVLATTFDTNVVAAGLTLSGTTLSADGTDLNIDINITAKGTGQVIIDDLQLGTPLTVQYGGTGAATLTDHAPLLGSGTAAITSMAAGLNGETIMGSTGADCSWTSSPQFGGSVTATNDINTTAGNLTASNGGLIVSNNAVSNADAQIEFRKTRTSGIITANDGLGTMRFEGYDGVSFISGAKITSTNSGTPGANQIAGNLQLWTHPDSIIALPSEPLLRMTIASTGAVTISNPDSGTGLTVSGSGITCTAGAITATLGDVVVTSGNLTLPTTSNTVGQITINSARVLHSYGADTNIFLGKNSGNFTMNGTFAVENTATGWQTLDSLTGTAGAEASKNSAYGYNSLTGVTLGYRNSAYGSNSGTSISTGYSNCYFGDQSGYSSLTTGHHNCFFGNNAGGSYTSSEHSNIILGADIPGVLAENNTLRIGKATGTGTSELDAAYIAGIYGKTVGATNGIVYIDNANLLGSTNSPSVTGSITAGTTITTTNGAIIVNSTSTTTAVGAEIDLQRSHGAGVLVTAGDYLGLISFKGYDGANQMIGAQIRSVSNTTIAPTRMPSNLEFWTHPDTATGDAGLVKRMTIASTGAVTIASPDSGVGLTVSGGGITCTSGAITATSGNVVVTSGNLTLPTSTSTVGQIVQNGNRLLHTFGADGLGGGTDANLFLGKNAGNFTMTTGTNYGGNCGISSRALESLVGGGENFAMGHRALGALRGTVQAGGRNVAIGNFAGYNLVGNSTTDYDAYYNIYIGYSSGNTNTTTEQANIYLNSPGVAGESHVLRIGNGSSSTAGSLGLAKAYIGGIYNVAVGATAGVVLADSTNQIGSISGTAGQILQGGTKPAFSTATYPSTTAQGDLLLSTAANTITALAKDTNATRYLSNTGTNNNAAWAQVALATGVSGTLPPANGGAMTWTEVTGTSQAAAVNNGYIANNVALVTVTLPAAATVGQRVAITGSGAGLWSLAQVAGQTVHFGSFNTETGIGGSITASVRYDCIEVQCTTANTDWVVIRSVGALVIV